jgi:hypothetical protein
MAPLLASLGTDSTRAIGLSFNPPIVRNGLVLALDAGDPASYSGTGTTWNDVSGNGNTFTLNNAGAYNSAGPKYMDFNGSFGASYLSTQGNISLSNPPTYMTWTRVLNSTGNWRTLTRSIGGGANHHVIILASGNTLGSYNNTGLNSPLGFNDSGYQITSIPGYGTSKWVCMYWRWSNSNPYYQMSYNDTPGTIQASISTTGAVYSGTSFGSLGCYDANGSPSQFWGDISSFYVWNRTLSDAELLQSFQATRSRYGL